MTLLLAAAAWIAGVACAAAGAGGAHWAVLAGAAGLVAGFGAARRFDLAALWLASALLFVAGSLHLQAALPSDQPRGLAVLNGTGTVHLRGAVAEEPEPRGAVQRIVLQVTDVQSDGGWQPARGRVLITANAFPEFAYGDLLQVEARLETPPSFDRFDYREYLARQGIVSVASYPRLSLVGQGGGSVLRRVLIDLRTALGVELAAALPEPEAALGRGILLGQRTSIPPEVDEDFRRAGISHLIAISGSNVAIVAGMVQAALGFLGRRRSVIASMAAVCLFVLLVGASPSVLRAGLMAVLMLGAILAGRPRGALSAVALAGATLTAVDPLAIFDAAFQLSFAATLGLILFTAPITTAYQALLARALPFQPHSALANAMAVTSAATLATLPITAATFGTISLVALPANLLAVPLFSLVLATSAATVAAGLLSDSLARGAGAAASVPLSLMIEVAQRFSALSFASIEISDFGRWEALCSYAAIAVVAVLVRRRRVPEVRSEDVPLRLSPVMLPALISVAAVVVWVSALTPDPGTLRVTVLDVGQGDAILVEVPSGERVLIDGGPSGSALLNALGDVLPGRARAIDLVLLTHPQEDHIAGLPALFERFDVSAAASTGFGSAGAAYQAWLEAAAAEGIAVWSLEAGQVARLGQLAIEVLAPPRPFLDGTGDDVNNSSMVLRLTYGDVRFLLTGDLGLAGEEWLLDTYGSLRAAVLKVGHHGSDGSTSEEFVAAVRPAVAVISTGSDNPHGHPSPTTLLRLAGIPVFRTDRNGHIRFETDGKRLFVDAERGDYQMVPAGSK